MIGIHAGNSANKKQLLIFLNIKTSQLVTAALHSTATIKTSFKGWMETLFFKYDEEFTNLVLVIMSILKGCMGNFLSSFMC